MNKLLVVVDMQNDFVSGSLGFKKAETIIEPIENKIKEYLKNGDTVLFTQDTHFDADGEEYDYKETREGRYLPIKHCIHNTKGWQIIDQYQKYLDGFNVLEKYNMFGIIDFDFINSILPDYDDPKIIEIVGLVTNLCVLSCAVCLQTAFSHAEIIIDAQCTTCPDENVKKNTLELMKQLQMQVINE